MPFSSQAQRRFMYLKHPKLAKKWAAETKNMSDLPEHKTKSPWMHMSKKGGN